MRMDSSAQKDADFPLLTESRKSATTTATAVGPAVPADPDWGIDTVTLSFDVNPDLCSLEDPLFTSESTRFFKDSAKSYDQLTGNLQKSFADIRVVLFVSQGICNLSFNAARLLTPASASLLPAGALKPLVAGILDDIQSAVVPLFDSFDSQGTLVRDADWAEKVRVTRLDVARNFVLDDPAATKAALLKTKPKNGKFNHLYWDNRGGWTLANSTKSSGMDRLYDKSAELANHLEDAAFAHIDGLYRFEAQLQKDRIQAHYLNKLSLINDERVWSAILKRWEACRWDVLLPERGTLQAALNPLSLAKRESLIGSLFLTEKGWTEGMNASHVRTRDVLARSVGLLPGMALNELGLAARKLDLRAGKIVDI
jgi:hypothetical protein